MDITLGIYLEQFTYRAPFRNAPNVVRMGMSEIELLRLLLLEGITTMLAPEYTAGDNARGRDSRVLLLLGAQGMASEREVGPGCQEYACQSSGRTRKMKIKPTSERLFVQTLVFRHLLDGSPLKR